MLRAAVGVVLLAAPRVARARGAAEQTGSETVLARTVGVRDLVLGLGTLAAAAGDEAELRRWVTAGLASDALDVAVAAASVSDIGTGGAAVAGLAPVPFVVAGLWALRSSAD